MTKTYLHRVSAIETLSERITKDVSPNHVHAHKMASVAAQLKNSVQALGKLYETPDPTVTRAAHEKRVATAANKLAAQVKSSRDDLNSIMQEGMRDIQHRIDRKVSLKPGEFAAEIRAMYRNLKPGEQTTLLSKLAVQNKGPELAAIVSVPAILTGISDELQIRFSNMIIEMHARDEFNEQKALLEALSPAFVVTDVAKETANEFSDPGKLLSIARGEEAAAAAMAAFENSTHS